MFILILSVALAAWGAGQAVLGGVWLACFVAWTLWDHLVWLPEVRRRMADVDAIIASQARRRDWS